MTFLKHVAVFLDLHSLSNRSASSHASLINKTNDILTSAAASSSDHVTTVYILTSHDCNVIGGISFCVDVEKVLVLDSDRVGCFYKAKNKGDELEVSQLSLVCGTAEERFWTDVCQLLLTPVYEWHVHGVVNTNQCNLSTLDTADQEILPSLSDSRYSQTETNCLPYLELSGSETSDVLDGRKEDVRFEIQRYLKTIPSMLGMPEVDRSRVLPGADQGFAHGWSTRRGGVSRIPTLCGMNAVYTDRKREPRLVIEENLRRLALVGDFDHTNFHIVKVEHGHRVWVVGEPQPPKFDALVTDRAGVTIAAAGADCIPLLFADPVARVIGAAHAGWRGTVERVAQAVVQVMVDKFHCEVRNIRVGMGPGVRLGCFKVLKDESQLFANIHPSCRADTLLPFRHEIPAVTNPVVIGDAEAPNDGSDGIVPPRVVNVEEKSEHVFIDESCCISSGILSAPSGCDSGKLSEAVTSESVNDVYTALPRKSDDNISVNDEDKTSSDTLQDLTISGSKRFSVLPEADFKVETVATDSLKPKVPPKGKDPSLSRVYVDLQRANYHVLLQAGLRAENIDMTNSHCTKCNPHLYFSCERDGFPFGNQIGFISMQDKE